MTPAFSLDETASKSDKTSPNGRAYRSTIAHARLEGVVARSRAVRHVWYGDEQTENDNSGDRYRCSAIIIVLGILPA